MGVIYRFFLLNRLKGVSGWIIFPVDRWEMPHGQVKNRNEVELKISGNIFILRQFDIEIYGTQITRITRIYPDIVNILSLYPWESV
ncbi:MAG: hypothetical protein Kow0042_11640 [Calditrichia bacterium]